MRDESNQGGGDVSIGEGDQLQDREMLRELQDKDCQQDDRQRPTPKVETRPVDRQGDDYHPGEAEQPDP